MSTILTNISGFPEFLPSQQIIFEKWKKIITHHFESYGFTPLETPAVERLETLLSKGDDHEIYGLYRLSGEDTPPHLSSSTEALKGRLGLRFDLTVPLARYVTQHQGQLVFPFRRYHIAPVWRGERPQDGRYRQFYQCDIDVVGRETLSPLYDSEIVTMMWGLIQALNLGACKIVVNHRGILMAWLRYSEVRDQGAALRLIDKRGKIPLETIIQGLQDLGATSSALRILEEWAYGTDKIDLNLGWSQEFSQDVESLFNVVQTMEFMGVPPSSLFIDPLLARGLAYYTGTIYEVFLKDKPSLGAVCAGGRYAHLAESFCKQAFPGVGMSFGLSRVFSAFMDLSVASSAHVLVTTQDPSCLAYYLQVAQGIRAQGLNVETYLEAHPLSAQLKYAHRKGFPFVIIANREEIAQGSVQIKNMMISQQLSLSSSKIATYIKSALSTL